MTGHEQNLISTLFRWVLDPQQSTTLRIRFSSERLAVVDQTLSFELLGTKKNYQIFCRGTCAFPTIDSSPKTLFPKVRKGPVKADEIVAKQFLLADGCYTFGPLLCNKIREPRNKYVENQEKVTFVNKGPFTAELSFAFRKDATAVTFLLDPPNMVLAPKEKKVHFLTPSFSFVSEFEVTSISR